MSALIIFCWHCSLYHLAVNNGALLRGFKTSGSGYVFGTIRAVVSPPDATQRTVEKLSPIRSVASGGQTTARTVCFWYFPRVVTRISTTTRPMQTRWKLYTTFYVTRFSMAVRISIGKCWLKLQEIWNEGANHVCMTPVYEFSYPD